MLWPSTTQLELRVLGGRDTDQGVEVVGVFGDVTQVHPLAAGAAVSAQVKGVHREAGLAEALRDVVVAAGVLGVAVAQHDHARGVVLRFPHVIDDADTADAVEGSFGSATGHQGRVTSACRYGLRKLGAVSVLAHETDDEFLLQAEPHRRELLAHCYRMTGSLHDAEDLVQETYLRAWKAYGGFKGQSSLRTWLYRIATNTCLTALEGRQRRPLPAGLGQPSADPGDELNAPAEVQWLEPLPDQIAEDPADPSVIVGSRESVRLAFVAALQHLSPRQRAVLVMRDVLQWKAAEVGDAIGASTAAVNSLLQRARAQLDAVGPSEDDKLDAPDSPETKDLLDRYIAAFEAYDIDKLVEMFTEEAVWEMPPYDGWYRSPAAHPHADQDALPRREGRATCGLVPTTANGQPAAGLYMRNKETGAHEAFQFHVIDMRADGVSHVVAFGEGDTTLFAKFGLPATL